MLLNIDYSKCCWKNGKCSSCSCDGKCEGCAEVCPVGAITRKEVVKIDTSKCLLCGACVAACRHDALSLK